MKQNRSGTLTHGMTKTITYTSWSQMWQRVKGNKPNYKKYYVDKGITVCDRWERFENFYADMGERPSKLYSIDRINNDGNYEPSNCRWATSKEQNQNKHIPKMDLNVAKQMYEFYLENKSLTKTAHKFGYRSPQTALNYVRLWKENNKEKVNGK